MKTAIVLCLLLSGCNDLTEREMRIDNQIANLELAVRKLEHPEWTLLCDWYAKRKGWNRVRVQVTYSDEYCLDVVNQNSVPIRLIQQIKGECNE